MTQLFEFVQFRCGCGKINSFVVRDGHQPEIWCDCGKLYKRIGDVEVRAEILHRIEFNSQEIITKFEKLNLKKGDKIKLKNTTHTCGGKRFTTDQIGVVSTPYQRIEDFGDIIHVDFKNGSIVTSPENIIKIEE